MVAAGPAASQEASYEPKTLDGRSDYALACRGGITPKARTPDLVGDELASVRRQLDRHIAAGRLRLAGECCIELDQLLGELAGLKAGTR